MVMAMSTEKIEVITSVQRRRRFSVDPKIRLVEETNLPGMSVSHVARIHGVAPSQLFTWRRRMAEGSREAVGADDDVVSVAEVRDLRKQVAELQRVLGKKTMEVEILREAVQLMHEKNRRCACNRLVRKICRENGCGYLRSLSIQSYRAPERGQSQSGILWQARR